MHINHIFIYFLTLNNKALQIRLEKIKKVLTKKKLVKSNKSTKIKNLLEHLT